MSKDISDIIESIQSVKRINSQVLRSFHMRNREEEFMYFGREDVVHDEDQVNYTYCETNFPPPHLYPTESLFLRTWRFYSLPEDLTFESEGCKVKQRVFMDEGIEELGLVDTHFAHTYFHPTDTGYLIVRSGGVEAKVCWEKREDGSFILSDFEGRKLEIYPSYVEEVRTSQEEREYYEERKRIYHTIDSMKALSSEVRLKIVEDILKED